MNNKTKVLFWTDILLSLVIVILICWCCLFPVDHPFILLCIVVAMEVILSFITRTRKERGLSTILIKKMNRFNIIELIIVAIVFIIFYIKCKLS